jgi:formylglycine-generating enzyme required for sulfatase activity
MHGNVWEWVQDWYGDYAATSATDPRGPSTGRYRSYRGGGWGDFATGCRSASRAYGPPSEPPGKWGHYLGFRLALSLESDGEQVETVVPKAMERVERRGGRRKWQRHCVY